MKNKLLKVMAVALGLLALSVPLLAHHGTNLYDMTKQVVLKGTITQFEWSNPHNLIYFDVTDDKGNVAHWVTSTEPPAVMSEKGWTRKSLVPGEQITAYVYAAKNGVTVGNLEKVIKADGTELAAGFGAPNKPPDKPADK